MTIKLGVIMDPITTINPKKDSTLAMLLEAQQRDWQLSYMELNSLFMRDGRAYADMRGLSVKDHLAQWHDLSAMQTRPLDELDVILMRKDPPMDLEYLYATYTLEHAEREGVLVVNRPSSLRDANEKAFALNFPQCMIPTLLTSQKKKLEQFLVEQGDIVIKPLDAMGGQAVFFLREGDLNTNVILETMTAQETRTVMAQRFIPEVKSGDKRILMINGEPVPYALARMPAAGEIRANLAQGGQGQGIELSDRDRWICEQVGPTLKEKGLYFVGIDVIGDYLTEINVTSPTCIRELDAIYDLNISAMLMDFIEQQR